MLSPCSQERNDRESLNHDGIYRNGSSRSSWVASAQPEGNNYDSAEVGKCQSPVKSTEGGCFFPPNRFDPYRIRFAAVVNIFH